MLVLKFLLIVFLGASVSDITAKTKKAPPVKNAKSKKQKKPLPKPKNEPKEEPQTNILEPYGIEVDSTHALLVDYETGKVLLEKNASQPFEPASMTKIMTAYMVMKALHEGRITPETLVTISPNARKMEGSDMFLEIGDKVSVEDLLKGLIIVSGNDAAIALAEFLSGTQTAFAADMTHIAKEIGCTQTEFKNASGLPEEGHRTTAHDLILMSKRTFEDFPKWYGIHKEITFTYRGITQQNRNMLLEKNIGCDGVKTGHAEKPGYGMVASAAQNGRRLFLVVSGLRSMKQRAEEAYRLLQWGFGTFGNYTITPRGKPIIELPIRYSSQETVEVEPKNHVIVMHRNRIGQTKEVIKYQKILEAPIKAGDQVGEVTVTHPDWNEPIVIPLIVKKDIPRSFFLSRIGQTLRYLFEKRE
jgi:D-alanyl-D-alanine carboxypeptidase (penicillin-binding protein 5/6)